MIRQSKSARVLSEQNVNSPHSDSSSLSSVEVQSSMETVPCDFVDGFGSGEDESSQDSPWGRLFPLGSSFTAVDLVKDSYTFGRGDDCDYQFSSPAMRKHPCFQAYSKVHFKLVREDTSTGTHIFLHDLSSNGTFVNGDKVGKGCKQVLNNNDEISLSLKKNRAFVFMDPNANEDKSLPEELKEKYTMSKLLGRGACGEVKLAFEKGSCQKVAIKIVQKKKFSVGGKTQITTAQQVMSEVNILKSLKHPCIIHIEDIIDTTDTLYIVLELVEGGELFDRVIDVNQFEEPVAKLLFFQMATAVKYLHDQGITHRDLKPENILLAGEENETLIKVTDFGLSKFVDNNTMMKTFCGTPNYLAPEILLTAGHGAYTNAIDAWSLGVILFICLVGYPPFSDDRKDMDLTRQITGGHYDFPEEFWGNISKDAIDLIKQMMTVDPKKRITFAEVLQHPWLQDEEMKKKANHLMSADSGMAPPAIIPKKRKGDGEESATKRKT